MTIAAIRFNNPGNVSLPIRGYSGPGTIVGISGQPGYGAFPTMQDGYSAMSARLNNYVSGQGLNTISALNTKYATDPNWKNGVSALSGIGVNDPIDASNPTQMAALQNGIIQHETGMTPSALGIGDNTTLSSNAPSGAVPFAQISGGQVAPGTFDSQSPNGATDGSYSITNDTTTNRITTISPNVPADSADGTVNLPEITNAPQTTGTAGGISTDTPSSTSGFGQAGQGTQLPGPLGGMLGAQPTLSANANTSIFGGMWEAAGVSAVTTAGAETAQATTSAAKTQADATLQASKQQADTLAATSAATNATATQNTAAQINAAGSYQNTWLDNVKDLFVRGWIGFFGLVLIAGAIYYFMSRNKSGQSTQQVFTNANLAATMA